VGGMALFMAEKRTKEIAVRKIYSASVSIILRAAISNPADSLRYE